MNCEICGKELEERKAFRVGNHIFCNKHGNAFEMLNGNLEALRLQYKDGQYEM